MNKTKMLLSIMLTIILMVQPLSVTTINSTSCNHDLVYVYSWSEYVGQDEHILWSIWPIQGYVCLYEIYTEYTTYRCQLCGTYTTTSKRVEYHRLH